MEWWNSTSLSVSRTSCVISRAILLSGIFTPKMSVFVTMSSLPPAPDGLRYFSWAPRHIPAALKNRAAAAGPLCPKASARDNQSLPALGLDVPRTPLPPRRRGDRKKEICCAAYVAYWHSLAVQRCPLLRRLVGVKRKCCERHQSDAPDPTETSARVRQLLWSLPRRKLEPIRSPV